MSFTAEVDRQPEEVLALLGRGLSREHGDSWSRSHVLTSPTNRVYVRGSGNEFHASRHAGMSMFGAIARGTVESTAFGSVVDVQFRFGIAPYGFPATVLVASSIVAAIGMLRSLDSIAELLAWASIPAAASSFWWHARWEVRVILEHLGIALGGVAWRQRSS